MELEEAPFDPLVVAEEALRNLEPIAKKKSIALKLDGPSNGTMVVGDSARLRQILLNLAGNAVKFTERGEVRIQMEAKADGDRVDLRFCVRDTGIGMTEDVLAKIFAPFVQADSSMTKKFGGTGLGLSICRTLVEAMGGEIRASSTPGEGSEFEFHICLPKQQPALQKAGC